MTAIRVHTCPPRWMQAAVSCLLPPPYREPVLGDLQERFAERRPVARWVGYIGDVVTTVPHVVWSQSWRFAVRGLARAPVVPRDLRSRAEGLQTQIWFGNVVLLVSAVFLIVVLRLNTRTGWHFNDVVSLAMTMGWIAAIWQSRSARGSTVVPASLSWDELRTFHRDQLIRQMDLRSRPFFYWSLPTIALIVYALAGGVPGFRSKALILLGCTAMQVCVVALSYRKERGRCQRELDRLDQEVEQA